MTKLSSEPTYQLSEDLVVALKPVPPFMLYSVSASEVGKPEVPYHEVKIAGKIKVEPNYADKGYRKALEDYEQAKQLRVLRYLFSAGVKGIVEDYISDSDMLEEIYDSTRFIFGENYTKQDLKYIWLNMYLDTEEKIEQFQEAIESLSIATENGKRESSKSSDSDSGQ